MAMAGRFSTRRVAAPGTDAYLAEGYTAQISALFAEWGRELKISPPGRTTLQKWVDSSIESISLNPIRETLEDVFVESVTAPDVLNTRRGLEPTAGSRS